MGWKNKEKQNPRKKFSGKNRKRKSSEIGFYGKKGKNKEKKKLENPGKSFSLEDYGNKCLKNHGCNTSTK